MTKKFILNILINLGLVFLVMSGIAAYNSGHLLFLGLSIALSVVLIYFKVVLLKYVNKEVREKQETKLKEEQKRKSKKG